MRRIKIDLNNLPRYCKIYLDDIRGEEGVIFFDKVRGPFDKMFNIPPVCATEVMEKHREEFQKMIDDCASTDTLADPKTFSGFACKIEPNICATGVMERSVERMYGVYRDELSAIEAYEKGWCL